MAEAGVDISGQASTRCAPGFEDPPKLAWAASEEEAFAHYRRVRDDPPYVETLPQALDTRETMHERNSAPYLF